MMEVGQPPLNGKHGAVSATVSLCNSKGVCVASFSTAVFSQPAQRSGIKSVPSAGSVVVGEHFFFDNVLYEGSTVEISVNAVGAETKVAAIGSTSIPVSRLEENVSIEQWYSLPPSLRAAVKLSLLYQKERVISRPRSSSGASRYSALQSTPASGSGESEMPWSAAGSSYAVTQELSRRLSVCEPASPAPGSPRDLGTSAACFTPSVDSLASPLGQRKSGASSPSKALFTSVDAEENLRLAADQQMILDTLAKLDQLDGREEETKVERPKFSEIEPILVRKVELAKDKSPATEAAAEQLPAGVIDYAIIFGPQSLSTRARQRSASSSSTPVSSSRSSALAALSPTSPGSTSSSLRAITESNVRQCDRFPAHDLVDSPLPGKIEWFACPEGCKWVQSVERPEPYISSFVLTAGGLADDLFGVSLNFFIACVEQFDTSSPQDDLTSPDDQSPAAEIAPWYDESMSSAPASGTQWVCIRLCVVSRWAFFEQLGQTLLHLYSSSLLPLLVPWEYSLRLGQSDEQDCCLPLDLGAFLTSLCFRCPVPVPGVYSVSLRLESPQERERARVIHLLLASPRDLPLCPYSLANFVSALGPRGCVHALSCALSECKMLLHSEDLSKLPPFCEALRALLYPLRWAHVYLPVVPAALLDLMEAPVPFILGTHTAWLKYIPSECLRDVVLVDCDSGAIDFGTADRLVFPVAEDRWLVSALKMIMDPLEGRQDEALLSQPTSSRHSAVDAVLAGAQIQAAVFDVLVSFLRRVPDCLFYLHASSPVFNRNLLLGTHGPNRRKFLEILTDTNSFHTFTEELSSSPGLAFFRETLAWLRRFEEGLNFGISSPLSVGSEVARDDVRAAPASPIRRPAGELVSSPLASTKRRFFVDAESEATGGAAAAGKHQGELSVPVWVSLGRSMAPGPRKLLDERLSLYVPHIQWLRETAQHAGCDGVDQEALVATGAAPLLAFSLALPVGGAKPRGQPSLPPPPLVQVGNVGSPLSINVGHRNTSIYSSMLLLDSRDALPPSISSSKENGGLLKTLKAHKVCTLVEDPSIAVLGGMDKETFLAHFLDSSRSLSEERGLTQQLESSKDAVFGFLVEDRNVNSSLQAVLRFLQLVISGRGSQDEMQDCLGNCVNSLQIAANRLALISLLKEAKSNSPHSSHQHAEQSPQQRAVYVFPLNASMFDALSRCFQAFLQICVVQNDFLSAYDLLEVGGLYYMPASIAAASEAAEVDGHDIFLSAHILQHPVYQSSLLWRGVLNNRLTSQPSSQQPQVRVVVSEAQNYLGIMAALGINFFRAMDFVQAVQSDWGLKLEEYLELARYTKKLWADVEQSPQHQIGDSFRQTDGSNAATDVGSDDLLHLHVQPQHTRSHSPSFSVSRRASDAGSDAGSRDGGDADLLNLPAEDRDSSVGGRERAASLANDLNIVASPFRSGSRQHTSTIDSRYVQLALDPAFARESISSATCLGGDAFAVGCESGHVLLSSFSRKECVRVKHGPDPLICVAAVRESSSSGSVPTAPWRTNEGSSAFASVCSNSVVKLWLRSALTKPPVCAVTLKNHSHAVTCLSAAGYVDGRFLLASGDAAGDVRISLSPSSSSSSLSLSSPMASSAAAWAQHSHSTARSRDGSRATTVAVGAAITAISTAASAFVKDDSLALGTRGGAVELLDLGESLRPICRTQAHGARVNSIVFVRPKQFITCSDDRGVSLWDVRVKSPVMFLPVEEQSSAGGGGGEGSGLVESKFGGLQMAAQGPVTDITVGGHDNALIISAAADNSIKIWDHRFSSVSRPSCVLRGHKGRVTSVSWDAASDHLQSCSVDGTVRTWDAVTGSNIDLTWTWAPCLHLSTAAFESVPGATSKSAGVLARTYNWRGGELKAFLRLCD